MNNLESKHSLFTKFSQFISYYKKKDLSENYTRITAWKLVPGPFVFAKN